MKKPKKKAGRAERKPLILEEFYGSFKEAQARCDSEEIRIKIQKLGLGGKAFVKISPNFKKGRRKLSKYSEGGEKRRMVLLYLIEESDGDCVKIGISDNPKARLSELQTGNPNNLLLRQTWEIKHDKPMFVEKQVHGTLKKFRVRGEWFTKDPDHETQIDQVMSRYSRDRMTETEKFFEELCD